MQEVTLSLFILLAGLPALDANDPEDKNSPFYYDWRRLRIGGLVCAAVLCTIGIIVLMTTIQGTPHLSSPQALPRTVEDGSAERTQRSLLFLQGALHRSPDSRMEFSLLPSEHLARASLYLSLEGSFCSIFFFFLNMDLASLFFF
ncbi:FXYD domain-containing ion transport regulator 3 isoform X2 [Zalophus californianus]|uniref:FXYD domain-containing ion transport regulator n=1 Tax=Zalophus californianus TaxID=9704 RepID=A0A6J2EXI1_ZALCA|nr:FXYD domain-containing ion transport regulator 3 isoform X2 [Zalophus californianus]